MAESPDHASERNYLPCSLPKEIPRSASLPSSVAKTSNMGSCQAGSMSLWDLLYVPSRQAPRGQGVVVPWLERPRIGASMHRCIEAGPFVRLDASFSLPRGGDCHSSRHD